MSDHRSEAERLAADAHLFRLAQANKLIRLAGSDAGGELPEGPIQPDHVDYATVRLRETFCVRRETDD